MPRYKRWPIHEARDKLSEVIRDAEHHGPQFVTRRGVAAVIVSPRYFRRAANRILKSGRPLPPSLLKTLQGLRKTKPAPSLHN